LVLDVAFDRLEANRQELGSVIALHGIDVRFALRLVLEGLAEGRVLRIIEPIAIVERCLDALRCRTPRAERAFREKARAAEWHLNARGLVLLDELHGATASEEYADRLDAEALNLREQRLEVRVGELERQRAHDLTAVL